MLLPDEASPTGLVIFDLDGVLIDSKELHFLALNQALGPDYAISEEEHKTTYEGLPTSAKLEMLTREKGLPIEEHGRIWSAKQDETCKIFSERLTRDAELMSIFDKLSSRGLKIAVASNSIRNTVKTALLRLEILEYIDLYVSNEDVINHKPHPEMFWRCMSAFAAVPETTCIIEDSEVGRKAALSSKAHTIFVQERKDLTPEIVDKIIEKIKSKAFARKNSTNIDYNVLVPMAGHGSRFKAQGYTFPKPLIQVGNEPMIKLVVKNLGMSGKHTFIVQEEHQEKYYVRELLEGISPDCNVITVDHVTEGAACTTLLAKDFINDDKPLFLANSDQFLDWDSETCISHFLSSNADGGIVVFDSSHPKWSYAKLDNDSYVTQVAEKRPISNNATVGIYFWRKGSDYVKYAESMIAKDIRVNNEFYVCPVFNEAILDGKKIITYSIDSDAMWGLGTPEDLNHYLTHH